jgi:Tol biopolymer transport system component
MVSMTRPVAAGALLLLAACSGADRARDEALPPSIVLQERPFESFLHPEPSPDGTRLLWAEPVEGRSQIFVADAHGDDPVQITHGIWDRNPMWSPNGRWIAYTADAPDFDIFVVPSEGGEPRQLTSGPEIDETRMWLPDGNGVVFLRFTDRGTRTLVAPLDGGEPYPLVPIREGSQFVTPSPDGSRVVFSLLRGAESTIWVQDLDGGEARQLTTEGLEEGSEHMWSPDGRSVVYDSRRTGTRDIWIADLETGEHRQLTSDVNDDRFAAWSPDGRWIAFRSNRGGQNDVWIVPTAGGQARRITNDLAVEDFIRWRADGSLSFLSTNREETLQVQSLDGRGTRELVSWPEYQISNPHLSPDGRTVVFESDRSGNFDVWAVPFAGGEATPLATSPLRDGMPRISPDGDRLAFVSDRGGSLDLWVMPASGGEATRLTSWPSDERAPRWSPDGSLIAFLSNHESDLSEVWVVPAEGGEPRRLTTGFWGPDQAVLAWSPDGAWIYYVGVAGPGREDLFRVPVDGGEAEAIGAHPSIARGSLSPDGGHYAYTVYEGGWGWVEVIPTDDGAPRRLTDRTEGVYQPTVEWSPDGGHLIAVDYDFPSDTYDLIRYSWPDGPWEPLTRTPTVTEELGPFTPDGHELVVVAVSFLRRLVLVPAAGLGTEPAADRRDEGR